MNCVNISHPEYKNLLYKTKENPEILKLKISMWMNYNTNNRFPTVEEINSVAIYKDQYHNANPIKQLGFKYNTNTNGYMPHNVDLAQVQRDAKKLNLTVHKAASGNWFFKDHKGRFINPHRFNQLESKSHELPQKELTEKLLKWAEIHGIGIETMEELIKNSVDTDSYSGSTAVADLLNKLIHLDPKKEKIDTLAEEISHFATAILKDDISVKKAMEKIVDTEIYQEVKLAYASIHTTEKQFRKEAVDKLLAQSIVEQFKEQEKNKGILGYLRAIFKKFFRWVNGLWNKHVSKNKTKPEELSAAEQIKREIYPIAQSILRNEYSGILTVEETDTTDSQIYPQLDPVYTEEEEKEITEKAEGTVAKTKVKFLLKSIKVLQNRLAILIRQAKNPSIIEKLQTQIESLKNDIGEKEYTTGIYSLIDLAEKELINIEKVLDKNLNRDVTNGQVIAMVLTFTKMYDDLFKSLRRDMHRYKISKTEQDEINEEINKVARKIQDVEDRNETLADLHVITVLTHGNTAPDGSKIDPDFDVHEIFEATKEDANAWRLQIGKYQNANSGILRVAHKLIYDATREVKRFAIDRGNVIMAAQVLMEKSGAKVEDIIELNLTNKENLLNAISSAKTKKERQDLQNKYNRLEKGNAFTNYIYTQNLIRDRDWQDFYFKRREMQEELAKTLGFKNSAELIYEDLTAEQLKIYKETYKKFNNKHRETQRDSEGNFLSYRPKKLNPHFKELMKNKALKNYYDLIVATKKESLKRLPMHYQHENANYLNPGIRKQFLERMTTRDQSFLGNIRAIGRESFFMDQDDTEFGETSTLSNRMVPIFFTKRFENPSDVSRDLTRSATIFAEMAYNFEKMNRLAGDMEVVQHKLAGRRYVKRNKEIEGKATNDYKILDVLMDSGIYGIEKKDFRYEIKPNAFLNWVEEKTDLKIIGKQFSSAKFMNKFARFVRANNLALNLTTSTAGYLKGSIDSILEDQIALYTTIESKNWARAEYPKNILHVLSEVPKKKQTNKMHLILQRNNVIALHTMLANSNKNKLLKQATSRDLLFLNYRTADYAIKGRVALAVYDNIRLYKGDFLTKERFIQKKEEEGLKYGGRGQALLKGIGAKEDKNTINNEWKALKDKSLYNAYEVVNGQLKVKEEFKEHVTDAIENATTGKIEHVAHLVDGTLSDADRGKLARGIFGDFILMHRGWFINMIDTRTMKEKTNLMSGEKEVGFYPATWEYISQELIGNSGYKAPYAAYQNLSPAKQRGVKRTLWDFIYLNIIGFIAALANLAADEDDDDNWTVQYFGYQLNRVLLEQAAGNPILKPSELLQMMDEPVVGVRIIKDLVDFTEAWNTDPYKRGMYGPDTGEDPHWYHTHAFKWWLRKTPAKNIYEFQFPEMKNNFIKQLVDSPTYNLLKDDPDNEKDIKGVNILERLKGIFQDSQSMSETEALNIVEYAEEND